MPPAKVGIIGTGISGPVLAIFLKLNDYDPVIYERNEGPEDSGIGIGIQRSGLRVLSKAHGLLEYLQSYPVNEFHFYSVLEEDKGVLGTVDYPKQMREKDGFGTNTILRTTLRRKLAEFVEKAGVPIKWSHKLETIRHGESNVTLVFANGVEETVDFVVGCDGLHSNTRGELFGQQPAEYMGIAQWGGVSVLPEQYRGKGICADIYGNGAHMIFIPISDTETYWTVSQREPEAKETWKQVDASVAEDFKHNSRFSQWGFGGGEIIKNSSRIIRYGIYGRPDIETWHKGRVLLISDAAHPASPHVGQGATQALEDIDVLVELLKQHNPFGESPSTTTLDVIFTELEKVRIPRVREMIRLARAQGETRVTEGVEACLARNDLYREIAKNKDRYRERFGPTS